MLYETGQKACDLDFFISNPFHCRKCKLEGELQKDDDMYSVTYAMVNDFGDTEQWIVTSSDMLSFARQVAQAMVSVGIVTRAYYHSSI